MDDRENILRSELSNLSYNDVRKKAKDNSISARGKKAEIIEKIIEVLIDKLEVNNSKINNFESDIDNKLNENDLIDDEKQQNSILSNENNNNKVSLNNENYLSDDNDINKKDEQKKDDSLSKEFSFISEDNSLHMDVSLNSNNSTVNKNEIDMEISANLSQTKNDLIINEEKENNDKQFTPKLKKSITIKERFARQHKKLFDKMPSICDEKKLFKKRLEKNDSLLSERIKKLALPKRNNNNNNIKDDFKKFSPPIDISNSSFKFGNVPITDYPKIQKKTQLTPTVENKRLNRLIEKKINVKQITMSASHLNNRLPMRKIHKATTPVLSARLEQLATPKGRSIRLTNEEIVSKSLGKKSYTPYRGRFDYVDTTQMNDTEYNEYIKSQK